MLADVRSGSDPSHVSCDDAVVVGFIQDHSDCFCDKLLTVPKYQEQNILSETIKELGNKLW